MGGRRAQLGAGLAAAVLAAAGCTSDLFHRDDTRRTDDPLLGGAGRPSNQPVAIATANQPAPTYNPTPPPAGTTPLPPLVPATPASNAALAGGGFQPLPGSSDLRIGNAAPPPGAPWPAAGATDPRAGGPTPAGNGSPVTPVPQSPAGGAPVSPVRPVSNTTAAPPGAGLDPGLAAAVEAYHPRWKRWTQVGEEWRFEVSVPNRQNPATPRTVEATAATPEAAVRAVLEQLAREP